MELEIPHEGHIKCIIWIRLVLDPDSSIEDYDDVSLRSAPVSGSDVTSVCTSADNQWPFDITAYLVSDCAWT